MSQPSVASPPTESELQKLSKEDLIRLLLTLTPTTGSSATSGASATSNEVTDFSTEPFSRHTLFDEDEVPTKILFDGHTLTPEHLVAIGYNRDIEVDLSPLAWTRVRRSRQIVDNILARKETVYGINTGFGNFASVRINDDQLRTLQTNLIRSHAAGVGEPLSVEQARMLLALRINVLAKGHSGIRPESLQTLLQCLRKNCISRVPCQGTVGASGDLAPLSHLALGILGEGQMWDPRTERYADAAAVLAAHDIEPLRLEAKEGLALINGTQLIVALGCEAVVRASRLARQADVVAALTVEALRGSTTPFHAFIHQARPHRGQVWQPLIYHGKNEQR